MTVSFLTESPQGHEFLVFEKKKKITRQRWSLGLPVSSEPSPTPTSPPEMGLLPQVNNVLQEYQNYMIFCENVMNHCPAACFAQKMRNAVIY